MTRSCARLIALALLITGAAPAWAGGPSYFAVAIGVNTPPDETKERLRYADDDAILFHRLLSRVGRSILLVDADAATRPLHEATLREARRPTRAGLRAALDELFVEIRASRAKGYDPQLVFFYSGHGDVANNEGYLVLDGARFLASDLERWVLAASPATNNHVIVDACRSYYLVHAKRAGGKRRPAQGRFLQPRDLTRRYRNSGFLLSTSSAATSHEWAALQAGIFSHEVRSALSGAADIDGDSAVSYDEVSAFVRVANSGIRNERFRPRIFVRPPRADGKVPLLDLRRLSGSALVIPGRRAGRYYLEDPDGVRLADLNTARDTTVTLRLPTDRKHLYLHDLRRRVEYRLRPTTRPLQLAALSPQPESHREKGAAHEAFTRLFVKPFSREALAANRYLCCTCADCEPGQPAPTRAPAPPPDAGTAKRSGPRHRPHRHEALAVAAGLALVKRSFRINDPVEPLAATGYESDMIPSLTLEVEAFPLLWLTDGPLAGIGLSLGYLRTVGAKTAVAGGSRAYDTAHQQFEVLALYRWNILRRRSSPNLRAGLGFGYTDFTIDGDAGELQLADVGYSYLKLHILGADVPIYTGPRFAIGAVGALDLLPNFSIGDLESDQPPGYGSADAFSITVRFGAYASYGRFFTRLEGHYQRFAITFDGLCWRQRMGCNYAGGALDEYYGVSWLFGYGL